MALLPTSGRKRVASGRKARAVTLVSMTTLTATALAPSTAFARAPRRMSTDEFLAYLASHPATSRLGRRLAGALADRDGST
jgi:hypothetical protein